MNAEAEAFLQVSRAYLFAPTAQDAGGAQADLAAPAYSPAARKTRAARRCNAGLTPRYGCVGEGADRAEPW